MTRVVMVFDIGDGQEAIVFDSQLDMEAWLDEHPAADECGQGMIPLTTKRALLHGLGLAAK
jgi:hypothetical protein